MRYSIRIKKFLYSQYFYGGLRIAIGVSLPTIFSLIILNNRDLGFTIATGAIGACAIDMPAPIKKKYKEMFLCSIIGFFSTMIVGISTFNTIVLCITIIPLTFILSLIVLYGGRWSQISFATLFMMIMTIENNFTIREAVNNSLLVLSGSLWYTYWSTAMNILMIKKVEQQILAESIFACANYLQSCGKFYDLDNDLDQCYRKLVTHQILAVESQDAARDIIIQNLSKFKLNKNNNKHTINFNLLINIINLHESFISAHTDYMLVRTIFGSSDLLIFYRDLINKLVIDLEEIGLAILQNKQSKTHINIKAELRAIEYEIELMRRNNIPAQNPEAYAEITATFRRLWSATRLIDKIRKNLTNIRLTNKSKLNIEQFISRFTPNENNFLYRQIFSNLTMTSPSFRHALRVTISVSIGFLLGRILPLINAYWIIMTVVIILKPGYSLTRQRNIQRMLGTLIGCSISIIIILFIKETYILVIIIFSSMVMSYSLLLFNYLASVVFTSSYVILLFHLFSPGSMSIINERAVDTIIGCGITIIASHLFPYWEYKFMDKLVNNMIISTREYLETMWIKNFNSIIYDIPPNTYNKNINKSILFRKINTYKKNNNIKKYKIQANSKEIFLSKNKSNYSIKKSKLDYEIQYCIAQKNVYIAFSNLGQSFQRMMLEPKNAQRFIAELNGLLIHTHSLMSKITSIDSLLNNTIKLKNKILEKTLQEVILKVCENLLASENGIGFPSDQIEIIKKLTKNLDKMVITIELSYCYSIDIIQDLKLLSHQCKQLILTSLQIRKDAISIFIS